jgi:molecular chaperone HscA
MGGFMDLLIPRNTKIPSKAGRQYTTQKDGQNGMRISVFQGERDLVQDNRRLAEFNLSGIPAMPAGLAKVEVSFLINADGILNVKAKELRSGVEQNIEVKPQYGLTDAEVEKMLMESIQYASADIKIRALVEAKTEAHQLIGTTQKFINKNAEFLLPEEIAKTIKGIDDLRSALDSENKDLIHQKTESLNEISRPYAERVMDMAISKAMSGKSIKDSI